MIGEDTRRVNEKKKAKGKEDEVETLTVVKESLLRELDLERVEMRRRGLGFGSMAGDSGEIGGEEEVEKDLDQIHDLEIKNRLLEEEVKGLRESLARVEDRKELLKVEKAKEGEERVVESFKELWLDRERLQVTCL